MLGLSLLLLLVGSLLLSVCWKELEGVIVCFWVMGCEVEVVIGLICEFEVENLGIYVDVQNILWMVVYEKLLIVFVVDGLLDVCQFGNIWIFEFVEFNMLILLQLYVVKFMVVDLIDYFQGIWDINVIYDELVGVLWYVDICLLYYCKDLLVKVGFDYLLWMWVEWNVMMVVIKMMQGVNCYVVLMLINEFEQQLLLVLQQLDLLLCDNDICGNFCSFGFCCMLVFYENMFVQGWVLCMFEIQIFNVWDEFFCGFNVFYVLGFWNICEFKKLQLVVLEGQWGIVVLLGLDGLGVGIVGGISLVIFCFLQQKEVFWKLIEFLLCLQIQQCFYFIIGDFLLCCSVWVYFLLVNDLLVQLFCDQFEWVKLILKVLEWEWIVQEMCIIIEQVVCGGFNQDVVVIELDNCVDKIFVK